MAGAIDKESMMKLIVCAATLVFLLWGTPALAGPCADVDGDGVCDVADNCIDPGPGGSHANPAQDDTDGDDCGNICDPDYTQSGLVGFGQIITTINQFALISPLHNLTEPVNDQVGFADIIKSINFFNNPAGPSGTTAGTTACP